MRGFNDIIGIVLMGSAVLLLVALLSYDAHDLAQNITEVNHPARNWIGPIGAHTSLITVSLWVGISGHVLVFILVRVPGVGLLFRTTGLCVTPLEFLDGGIVCLLHGNV